MPALGGSGEAFGGGSGTDLILWVELNFCAQRIRRLISGNSLSRWDTATHPMVGGRSS